MDCSESGDDGDVQCAAMDAQRQSNFFSAGTPPSQNPARRLITALLEPHNEAAFIVGSNVVIRRNTYIRRTTYYCANVILCHASPLTYTLASTTVLGLYPSVPVL